MSLASWEGFHGRHSVCPICIMYITRLCSLAILTSSGGLEQDHVSGFWSYPLMTSTEATNDRLKPKNMLRLPIFMHCCCHYFGHTALVSKCKTLRGFPLLLSAAKLVSTGAWSTKLKLSLDDVR